MKIVCPPQSRRFLGALSAFFLVTTLLSAMGCRTTGNPKLEKQAKAKYRVGVVLVHEAQEAAALGETQKQRLKYRDALEELLAAKEVNAKDPEILYLLGFVYFSGFSRHAEAEAELRKAISYSEKEYPEADNLLGQVLTDAGRPKEALPFFDRARKNLLYTTPYFAEQEMGWAKYKLGDLQGASEHLEGALAMQPDLCGAYLKLAEVYEAAKNAPKTLTTLQRFVDQCDTERMQKNVSASLFGHAYYRLAMAQLKQGEKAAAAAALRTCTTRFESAAIAAECQKSLALVE